jgi:hypothetical protein
MSADDSKEAAASQEEGSSSIVTLLTPSAPSDGTRVDPQDLDFDLLEENLRHPSAPKPKKVNYLRERCECKR